MKRPETNETTTITTRVSASNRLRAGMMRHLTPFTRDEDGAMIIFGLMMFMLMLVMGGLSFDLMRYESHRERLQATLDRAVLSAAALSQTLDAKEVVLDYFAKAGMSQFIDADDVHVTEQFNSRRVEATAHIHVPLHHGGFAIFGAEKGETTTLIASATSVAEESIGNVEISMVLDVSGSMNSYSRLVNLKVAAKDFIDTVYDAAEANAVSTSIIPYATQVNAGGNLLSYFNREDAHEFSHCVNFETSDFNSASMYGHYNTSLNGASTPLDQTSPFDAWTHENNGFEVGNEPPNPVCAPVGHSDAGEREILAWSTSKTDLKNYITALKADGNTSTDIGVKWGAGLLDPSAQSIMNGFIASNDAHAELAGRPYEYLDGDSMKILVVMTDGAHTSQYFMDDYRSGDSFVWKWTDAASGGDDVHYSIWHDGEGSAPITTEGEPEWVCYNWGYYGCNSSGEEPPKRWFDVYNTNFDSSSGSNQYKWRTTPYSHNGVESQRMTWAQVWDEIPPEFFSDKMLERMGTLNSTERNAFEYAIDSVGSSTKNARFNAICEAAKSHNVIIFTIGLEVSNSNATRLEACATSIGHYYDVADQDIEYAFQAIASKINQLRLTQ